MSYAAKGKVEEAEYSEIMYYTELKKRRNPDAASQAEALVSRIEGITEDYQVSKLM